MDTVETDFPTLGTRVGACVCVRVRVCACVCVRGSGFCSGVFFGNALFSAAGAAGGGRGGAPGVTPRDSCVGGKSLIRVDKGFRKPEQSPHSSHKDLTSVSYDKDEQIPPGVGAEPAPLSSPEYSKCCWGRWGRLLPLPRPNPGSKPLPRLQDAGPPSQGPGKRPLPLRPRPSPQEGPTLSFSFPHPHPWEPWQGGQLGGLARGAGTPMPTCRPPAPPPGPPVSPRTSSVWTQPGNGRCRWVPGPCPQAGSGQPRASPPLPAAPHPCGSTGGAGGRVGVPSPSWHECNIHSWWRLGTWGAGAGRGAAAPRGAGLCPPSTWSRQPRDM